MRTDSKEVVTDQLRSVSSTLAASSEARFLFVYLPFAMDTVLQCINNIDQQIMESACTCIFNLLQHNQHAHLLFLRTDGMESLSNCLHDYHIPIKRAALQILCVLIAEHPECRDGIREDNGILKTLVESIRNYDDDSTDDKGDGAILSLTLAVISHAVIQNPANQNYVRQSRAITSLTDLLRDCMEGLRKELGKGMPAVKLSSQVWKHAEDVCLCLNNLVFQNTANQNEMRLLGVLDTCVSSIQFLLDASSPISSCEDISVALLTLVVNILDSNSDSQDHLSNISTVTLVTRLLESSVSRTRALGALMLSHLAWNHPTNQRLFATKECIAKLLQVSEIHSMVGRR